MVAPIGLDLSLRMSKESWRLYLANRMFSRQRMGYRCNDWSRLRCHRSTATVPVPRPWACRLRSFCGPTWRRPAPTAPMAAAAMRRRSGPPDTDRKSSYQSVFFSICLFLPLVIMAVLRAQIPEPLIGRLTYLSCNVYCSNLIEYVTCLFLDRRRKFLTFFSVYRCNQLFFQNIALETGGLVFICSCD